MEVVVGAIILVSMIIIGIGVLYVVDTIGVEVILILCMFVFTSYMLGCMVLNK